MMIKKNMQINEIALKELMKKENPQPEAMDKMDSIQATPQAPPKA